MMESTGSSVNAIQALRAAPQRNVERGTSRAPTLQD